MSAGLTRAELWMLLSALDDRHARAAKQRAISERTLAEGSGSDATIRLACYEELDLAALDSLRQKLLPRWMQ